MKKLLSLFLTLTLCLCFNITAFASGEETTQDESQPRLMVTEYTLDGETLTPSKKSKLTITFKNYSQSKSLRNIKLSIIDESDEIATQDMPTKYVERIYAGSTYTWELYLTAAKTAQIGEHKLTVTSEYEDKYYTAYTATDTITINVKQSVALDYDGVSLPSEVVQGETQTLTVNLMNTGKTDLSNCKIDFSIDGLESGGTLFIGEILAGESKEGSANLKVSSENIGEVSGTATIYYEDAFGESYSKEVKLSTTIEKKVTAEQTETEDSEENTNSLWWLFALAGAAVGIALGAGIPAIVRSKKQRKEDELRL
ncbi:MAG: hypothetical protein LIO62_03275 [Clostridiales bacterium]|nr:hypothetical protein [Clostridiales bacterium]